MRHIKKLYNWVIHWASTPHAEWALFLLAFAESSFFPIPPDVLLMAMGVSRPKKVFRFAAVCLLGSVLGGLFGYYIGHILWQVLSPIFFSYIPGFTPEKFGLVTELYRQNAFWAVFTAGFTPIPYKVFTIAAGVARVDLVVFIIASIIGRSSRFFLIAAAFYFFGPKIKDFIDRYFNLLSFAFTALLVLGFAVIKLL